MNRRLLIFIAILIVGVAVGAVVWRSKNNSGNDQNSPAGNFYEIPDMGLKFELPAELQSLRHSLNQVSGGGLNATATVAYFSTDELLQASQASTTGVIEPCEAKDGPVGALVKISEFPADPNQLLPPDAKDFGSFLAFFTGPQSPCSPDQNVIDMQARQIQQLSQAMATLRTLDGIQGKILEQGTVEGSLSYPSEGLPPGLKTCAENTDTKKLFCTTDQLQDQQFDYGYGYNLYLPAGRYLVFSTISDPKDPAGYRGYYDQFVICGLKVECSDHTPIVVEVKAGETVKDVDPGDWYGRE